MFATCTPIRIPSLSSPYRYVCTGPGWDDPEQEPSADGERDALYTQDILLLLLGEGDDDADTAAMELQDPAKLCGLPHPSSTVG
jgi:hypothetical protein